MRNVIVIPGPKTLDYNASVFVLSMLRTYKRQSDMTGATEDEAREMEHIFPETKKKPRKESGTCTLIIKYLQGTM